MRDKIIKDAGLIVVIIGVILGYFGSNAIKDNGWGYSRTLDGFADMLFGVILCLLGIAVISLGNSIKKEYGKSQFGFSQVFCIAHIFPLVLTIFCAT